MAPQAGGQARLFSEQPLEIQRSMGPEVRLLLHLPGDGRLFFGECQPDRRSTTFALRLAFAHRIQEAIGAEAMKDQAEAARLLRLTRARVSPLRYPTLLAPTSRKEPLDWRPSAGPIRSRKERSALYLGCRRGQRSGRCSGPRAPEERSRPTFRGAANLLLA